MIKRWCRWLRFPLLLGVLREGFAMGAAGEMKFGPANFIFLKKNIESMASISLQPRQKRDLWLRVMTEAKKDAFWPRFNMPRFLNRGKISKITGAKRGYCTSDWPKGGEGLYKEVVENWCGKFEIVSVKHAGKDWR